MNKNELIDKVADATGLSKADAARAVDAFTGAVSNALKAGDSVALVGFGTFIQRHRGARTGQNPQTGEPVKIKASNTVAAAFIPGVSEKTSTASPKKNAHNINALRGVSDSNFSIN